MFVRNATWARIRDEFTEAEKAQLTGAIDGETICPPGYHVDETRMAPALALKLRDAMSAVAPGA
jgi:hypothetical protein